MIGLTVDSNKVTVVKVCLKEREITYLHHAEVMSVSETAQKPSNVRNVVRRIVNGDHGKTGATASSLMENVESEKPQEQERWKWRQAVVERSALESLKM